MSFPSSPRRELDSTLERVVHVKGVGLLAPPSNVRRVAPPVSSTLPSSTTRRVPPPPPPSDVGGRVAPVPPPVTGELDVRGGVAAYEAAPLAPHTPAAPAPHEAGQMTGGLVAWSSGVDLPRALPERTAEMLRGSMGGIAEWASQDKTWLQVSARVGARSWSGGHGAGLPGAGVDSAAREAAVAAAAEEALARPRRRRFSSVTAAALASSVDLTAGVIDPAQGRPPPAPAPRSFAALSLAAGGDALGAHVSSDSSASSSLSASTASLAAEAFAQRFRAILPRGPSAAGALLRQHWTRVDGDSDGNLTPEELLVGMTRLAPLGFEVQAKDVGLLARYLVGSTDGSSGGEASRDDGVGAAAAAPTALLPPGEGIRMGTRWPAVKLDAAVNYILEQPVVGLLPVSATADEGSGSPATPFATDTTLPLPPPPPAITPVVLPAADIVAHKDAVPQPPSKWAQVWLERQAAASRVPSNAALQWGRAVGAEHLLQPDVVALLAPTHSSGQMVSALGMGLALQDEPVTIPEVPMGGRRLPRPVIVVPSDGSGEGGASLPSLGSGHGHRSSTAMSALLSSFAEEQAPCMPISAAAAEAVALSGGFIADGGTLRGVGSSSSYKALHDVRAALSTPAGRASLASPRRPTANAGAVGGAAAKAALARSRFDTFRVQWEGRHGAAAAKEMRADAAILPEGPTWTRAEPAPFRVLRLAGGAPPAAARA